MRHLRFFIACLKMTIEEQMAFKLNFILRTMTLLSFDMVLPFVTILIYLNTEGFPGWDLYQIILFNGVFIFINSIDRMFFQRVDWSLSYDVRGGNFDRYLLYPVNTLAYISFTNLGIEHFADFLIGIALIAFSFLKLNLALGINGIILFFAYLSLAIVFIFTLAIIKYSLFIRFVKLGRVGELFRVIKTYGQYPADIYGGLMSSILRYIIPLAILAYYPSMALLNLGKENFFAIAFIIIALFFLSYHIWKNTLKQYTSAGG